MRKILIIFILLFPIFFAGCATSGKKEEKISEKVQKKEDLKKDKISKKKEQTDEESETEDNKKEQKEKKKKKKENKKKSYDGTKYIGPSNEDFTEGLSKYFNDDCGSAIKEWEKGLKKDDDRYQLAFNIGLCYQRLGKKEKSVKWYLKAYKMNPDFMRPLYNANILLGKGSKGKEEFYIDLIKSTKDNVIKNNFIAWLKLRHGDKKSAEEYAKAALKEDEQNADAVITLAEIYFSKKMYELAEMALSTAEKWNENNFRLHRLYGFLAYESGDKKKAAVHLQKAAKLNPELPEVNNILAVLAMEIEDFATAKEKLEFTLKIAPDFKAAKINLAIAYKGLEEFKKSRDILKELETDDTLSKSLKKSVIYNLAVLYLDADVEGDKNPNKFDTAIEYFNKYLKIIRIRSDHKKQKKLIAGYIKEAGVEKKKLEYYNKMRARGEKRKKELEEELKQFLVAKEKAFKEALEKDTFDVWEKYLKDFPIKDDDDKFGIAANVRYKELLPLAKEEAFKKAIEKDDIPTWESYLEKFPIADDGDKLSIAATGRLEELKRQETEESEPNKK